MKIHLRRTRHTVVLALLATSFWLAEAFAVRAQTDSTPTVEAPVGQTAVTDSDPRLLLLQQIKSLQEKLEAGLNGSTSGSREAASTATGSAEQRPATGKNGNGSQASAGDDLAKLKKRLEVLQLLLNSTTSPAADPTQTGDGNAATPGNPAAASNQQLPPALPQSQAPLQIPALDLTTTPGVNSASSATAVNSANPDPSNLQSELPTGVSLFKGPVDLFELANNTFAVGETEYALKIYESPELKLTDPNDLSWRDYYLACCYRSLGKTKEAEAIYRSLVEADKESSLGKVANWWLDHLDVTEGLKGALANFDMQLDHYRQQQAGKEQ